MENIYTYEVTENGYFIYINGKKVIHQYEPFIPDPTKSYQENAEAQIEELKLGKINEQKEKTTMEQMQEDITNIQIALTEIYESGV